MMLACAAWTALLLLPTGNLPLIPLARAQGAATEPSGSASGSASGPAAGAGAKDERAGQAATYYSRGRYVEASLEFEGLWRDFPDEPRFLFNAAASRYAAGHYAHTVAYLGEYLAREEIVGEDRKEAQAQLDEARNKVTGLQVSVAIPAGTSGEVTVVVKHVARGASDLRPELMVPTRRSSDMATAVVQLEPGSSWVVSAMAAGLEGRSQEVELTRAAGQQVTLQMTAPTTPVEEGVAGPKRAEGVQINHVRALKIGFGVGSGVVVAGLVAAGVGVAKRNRAEECDSAAGSLACRQELAVGLRTRDAGAAVIGAGFGVLAGSLVWNSRDARKRRTAWLAEASVGGLALIGGAVWLTVSSNKFNAANTGPITDWGAHYTDVGASRGHAVAATVFGLGAGLVGSAVTGLIVQRKRGGTARARALRIDGLAMPGRAGFMLSGRF